MCCKRPTAEGMRWWHRHKWFHGAQRVRSIGDIPEDSLFYRLDCGCGRSIDGVRVRGLVDPPRWLVKRLGFER